GFSFSIGLPEGSAGWLRFVAAEDRTPSLVDQELPGVVAVAWLDGLTVAAGETVLLGYVETMARAELRFYVASGDAQGQGDRVPPGSSPATAGLRSTRRWGAFKDLHSTQRATSMPPTPKTAW